MKKLTAMLLVLAMALTAFSGCSNAIDNSGYVPTGDAILLEGMEPEDLMVEEEPDQELTLAYYPNRSLNPIFGSDYTNRVLMSLMYQGLFAVSSNKQVYPILCSGYKVSTNSRNWTFYLEKEAKFSDGTKVTINDVVATYIKAMENDYYKYRFRHVLNIEATEDGGVIFQLDTPYENLPLILDVPIVKASEVDLTEAVPVGTGPYVFHSSTGGANLQRDPDWWCGGTKIAATDQTISLVEVSTPAQVRDAFQFGDVSVVCTNPMSDSFAEYRSDYELWEIESGYFLYVGCNIGYSDFFEDGTLRTYLTYAINRAVLAEEGYKSRVDTVTLPCSPNEVFYSKSLASKYEFDSLKFIQSIAHLPIPRDDKNQQKMLQILVNSDDSARTRIARNLAEDLTEMGLPATTLEKSGSGFKGVLQAQTYDIYVGMTRLSPNMDLSEFFRTYGELSRGSLAHETLNDMCLKALENSGNFYNLYQKLGEDGRIIPMMFGYYNVYAQRGLLPDLTPSRDNVFFYTLGKTLAGIYIEPVVQAENG